MRNSKFCLFIILIIITSSFFIGCIDEKQVKSEIKYKSTDDVKLNEKKGRMSFDVIIRTDEDAKTVRLWLPYPVSNENQKIEDVKIIGNHIYSGIYREPENNNMILYAEWHKPKQYPKLNISFDVWRKEVIRKNFPDGEGSIPVDAEKYLLPTRLSPTTGEVKEIADEITRNKKSILSKATAIYDYLVEHAERDENLNFCGNGDVCTLLQNLRGKCIDFSSVFVGLSRSVGVPSREILGTRISKNGDITGAYHCYAEFYLPNYGWVPVDPSDVTKLMSRENLELNDTKVIETRDYFFGGQSETYIELSRGRDIILSPEQKSDPLNYFMYPYAEVNGEPLDSTSQETLRYTVFFLEKPTK
jgi:transglutaminase-like putative cysteine protease